MILKCINAKYNKKYLITSDKKKEEIKMYSDFFFFQDCTLQMCNYDSASGQSGGYTVNKSPFKCKVGWRVI